MFSINAQIAFTCVVFPCLLLAYLGQAAYLMKYPDSAGRIFYDSVPGDCFPILIAAYIFMVHPIKGNVDIYSDASLSFLNPDGCFWPVFVIATLAAMIASQAMISATFSCVKQSMALGCFPRLKIVHTSKRLMGQIYIPVINWFLMVMCIIVVASFQSTTDIANAYG